MKEQGTPQVEVVIIVEKSERDDSDLHTTPNKLSKNTGRIRDCSALDSWLSLDAGAGAFDDAPSARISRPQRSAALSWALVIVKLWVVDVVELFG